MLTEISAGEREQLGFFVIEMLDEHSAVLAQ